MKLIMRNTLLWVCFHKAYLKICADNSIHIRAFPSLSFLSFYQLLISRKTFVPVPRQSSLKGYVTSCGRGEEQCTVFVDCSFCHCFHWEAWGTQVPCRRLILSKIFDRRGKHLSLSFNFLPIFPLQKAESLGSWYCAYYLLFYSC